MAAESEYHSNVADARINSAGAFARADWFDALHRHCLADLAPLIAHVHDGDAHLWMPMARHADGSIGALSNYYSFFWGPIWAGNPPAATQQQLLGAWAKSLPGSVITLGPVMQSDAMPLLAALRSAGWFALTDATSTNHWLEPAGRNFADWWAARPGALRSTVQRKAKKGRVALSVLTQFSDSDWDDYETVYRASWKPEESHPDFLRAWARAEGDAGRLRLGLARIDGRPVAAQFWTVESGTAYIHKLAHVSGEDALSPGTLLTHALFAHAFDIDTVTRIDFGTGDDGYKRDWMEASAPLLTIRAWRPQRPENWLKIGRAMLSRLAARRSGR